jgi:hypothetical protein
MRLFDDSPSAEPRTSGFGNGSTTARILRDMGGVEASISGFGWEAFGSKLDAGRLPAVALRARVAS